MIDFIKKYWLDVIFSGVLLGLSTAMKMLFQRVQKEIVEQAQIKHGILAILHDRLYLACHYHIKEGYITTSQLSNLEHLYNGYHTLGGNGTGTELYNRCKALDIKVGDD